jgi:anti-sigma B factor antagonist
MEPLVVETRSAADATIVALIGMADVTQLPVLEQSITQLCALKPSRVVVDLTRLTFIASISIAELMRFHHACKNWRGRMIVAGPNDDVIGSFHRAKLDKVFTIAPTVEAALAAAPTSL